MPLHFSTQLYTKINSIATVVNFGDESDLQAATRSSPALATGFALASREQGSRLDPHQFRFCTARVASILNTDVAAVKAELRSLQWRYNPATKKMRKSHIAVRFSDFSYLFRAPGNLTEAEIDEAATFLYELQQRFVKRETNKLRYLYCLLSQYMTDRYRIDWKLAKPKSDDLKTFLDRYFIDESLISPEALDPTQMPLPKAPSVTQIQRRRLL